MTEGMRDLKTRLRSLKELYVADLSAQDVARLHELERLNLVETSRYGTWSGLRYVKLKDGKAYDQSA
jgi:hypothetical protein